MDPVASFTLQKSHSQEECIHPSSEPSFFQEEITLSPPITQDQESHQRPQIPQTRRKPHKSSFHHSKSATKRKTSSRRTSITTRQRHLDTEPIFLKQLFCYRKEARRARQDQRSSLPARSLKCQLTEQSPPTKICNALMAIQSVFHFGVLSLFVLLYGGSAQNGLRPVAFTMETLCLVVHSLDAARSLRTTYLNEDGDQETRCPMIAKRYFRKLFWVDLFCLLPWGLVPLFYVQVLSLFKLAKVVRIQRVLRELDVSLHCKAQIRLVMIIIFLALVYHWLSCLWSLQHSSAWIPPLNWIHPSSFYAPRSMAFEYFYSLYYVLMGGIASGDMGPVSSRETVTAVLVILGGSLLSASTFAVLVEKMIELNQAAHKLQAKINTLNTIMADLALPREMRRQLRMYIYSTESTLHQQDELNQFLERLSPSLSNQVHMLMFAKVIKDNVLFKRSAGVKAFQDESILNQSRKYSVGERNYFRGLMSKFASKDRVAQLQLQMIASMLQPIVCEPQEVVIDYGDYLNAIYFIGKGGCRAWRKRLSARQEKALHHLGASENFGEVPMILGTAARTKVLSTKYTILGKLEKNQFATITQYFAGFFEKLKLSALKQSEPWKRKLTKVLRNTPYFYSLGEEEMSKLVYTFQMRQFDGGSVVLEAGEGSAGLWVVLKGRVLVRYREMKLVSLKGGSILNYDRFAVEARQQVSVVSESFVTCAFLSNEDIERLLQSSTQVAKAAAAAKNELLWNTNRPYALDYYLPLKRHSFEGAGEEEKDQQAGEPGEETREQLSQAPSSNEQGTKSQVKKRIRLSEKGRDSWFKFRNSVLRIFSINRANRRALSLSSCTLSFLESSHTLRQSSCQTLDEFQSLGERISESMELVMKLVDHNQGKLLQLDEALSGLDSFSSQISLRWEASLDAVAATGSYSLPRNFLIPKQRRSTHQINSPSVIKSSLTVSDKAQSWRERERREEEESPSQESEELAMLESIEGMEIRVEENE